jgi:hypothetical protein
MSANLCRRFLLALLPGAFALLSASGGGNALRAQETARIAMPEAPSSVLAWNVAGAAESGNSSAVEAEARIKPLPAVKVSKQDSDADRNTKCETGQLHGKPCRVSWPRVLGESRIFLSAQHGGNIWMDDDTRAQLTSGDFWGKYEYCVEHYRWSRWRDDDPFGVDYVGHPMMGAITSAMYEQNDPKQRALTFENTPRYWKGRLKAMAYSAAYSAQWKIGPASEASIGNTGIGYYIRNRDGVYTNETGMQDWFITPIGGLVWNVGEDVVDRYLLSHIRHAHPRNVPLLIVASALMTPTKSAANTARFRAFYYRDYDDETLKVARESGYR